MSTAPIHGWLDLGNIRANGHPGGQSWRQFQCVSCQGFLYETHGTIFHGKRSSPDLIVHVIACLAEGLGIRGTARVFEIDSHTVLNWLMEAAEQLQAFSAYFLHDLHLIQVQLDELYAVLSAVRAMAMGQPSCGNCVTPAMAAGLTDHRWSLREVWFFRVPLWLQPQMV